MKLLEPPRTQRHSGDICSAAECHVEEMPQAREHRERPGHQATRGGAARGRRQTQPQVDKEVGHLFPNGKTSESPHMTTGHARGRCVREGEQGELAWTLAAWAWTQGT